MKSQGKCRLCGGTFGKAAMAAHVKGCVVRGGAGRKPSPVGTSPHTVALHLVVEGHGLPQYWMHLEARADARLSALDRFLRRTWLECCGHLSAFRIAGKAYYVGGYKDFDADFGEKSLGMTAALGAVLPAGRKFFHEYDFGTTTELALRVVSAREAVGKLPPVRLLARNSPPDLRCESCGAPATQVCYSCIQEGGGWFCATCGRRHETPDADHSFLPVVNSPRVGMCGYTG